MGSCSVRWLLIGLVVATGCSNSSVEQSSDSTVGVEETQPEPIAVALSLYVLSEAGEPDSSLSSQRTTAELELIALEMNEIWVQANISFDPVIVHDIAVPAEVLRAIASSRDTGPFFANIGQTFEVPDAGVINGFYLRSAGGVNGFTTSGSRVFFVVDDPSVHDERVSSHEVGHILGLHHDLRDAGTLMFSGTNGMVLSQRETEVARYGAEGILDGQR